MTLIVFCLSHMANMVGADDTEQQHRAQLDLIKNRIAGVWDKMRAARGEQHQLTARLQSAEREIGAASRRIRELSHDVERLNELLRDLRRQEQTQLDDLTEQRRILAQQIYAAYVMGRQERLKIFLNQQDPALISRVTTYYEYLNRARAERMAMIERQLAGFRETRAEISGREAALRQLHDSELASRALLEKRQTQRRSILLALNDELRKAGKELTQLRENEEQLQQLIEEIEQALADIPDATPGAEPFDRRKGSLPWPLRGEIVASFASRKTGGLRLDGVMIKAPAGHDVRAVHHGRVAFADWLRGFGLLLILDHGDGWMTLYGHNQSLFKEVGDWVEADESVALVGSSGGRQTSGVYFGIRHQGKPIDPGRWCRKSKGRRVG